MKSKMTELQVEGVAVDHNNQPVVILKDKSGDRAVNIWIGPAEAVAISMELEQRHPPRPMTHDLIRNILSQFDIKVERLIINDVRDNTYFGQLILMVDSSQQEVDCRPSDGIAIALRANAPIFIPEELLDRLDEERKAREGAFIVDSGETVH